VFKVTVYLKIVTKILFVILTKQTNEETVPEFW